MRIITSALMLVAMTATSTFADNVYRVVDENGNIIYTDKPPADAVGSEVVELPKINTQPAVKPRPVAETGEAAVVEYASVTLVSPANNSTIPPGQQQVVVEVALQPALAAGHKLQLFYDGKPLGMPRAETSFSLDHLYRGSHVVSVNVIDMDNRVIARSKGVTFHVQRTSVIPGNSVPAGSGQGSASPPAPQVPGVPNS